MTPTAAWIRTGLGTAIVVTCVCAMWLGLAAELQAYTERTTALIEASERRCGQVERRIQILEARVNRLEERR